MSVPGKEAQTSTLTEIRFEYTPLGKPTSLRLIRLLPEDENGMLQIVMDEYDLDEHIPRSASQSGFAAGANMTIDTSASPTAGAILMRSVILSITMRNTPKITTVRASTPLRAMVGLFMCERTSTTPFSSYQMRQACN